MPLCKSGHIMPVPPVPRGSSPTLPPVSACWLSLPGYNSSMVAYFWPIVYSLNFSLAQKDVGVVGTLLFFQPCLPYLVHTSQPHE